MVAFDLDNDDITQQARALSQRWFRIGSASQTLAQYWITLTSKLSDQNFHPLEDVSRYRMGGGGENYHVCLNWHQAFQFLLLNTY